MLNQFYKPKYRVKINRETEIAILFGAKAGLVEISQCLLNPNDIAWLSVPKEYSSEICRSIVNEAHVVAAPDWLMYDLDC
ncbi:hypothetical protein [Virgibacillus proomii]|uniref:hypothetical protein n=1 Tax=Virgibacillus proomii TaxID=84407 RepID=UPI001C1101F9|nr:hypothetical protein [Virgibacillus proomii]MBU5268100.1 hypothetical protein [Virgibacillus proomii]